MTTQDATKLNIIDAYASDLKRAMRVVKNAGMTKPPFNIVRISVDSPCGIVTLTTVANGAAHTYVVGKQPGHTFCAYVHLSDLLAATKTMTGVITLADTLNSVTINSSIGHN